MPGISPSTSPLPRNHRRSDSLPPPTSVVRNQKLTVKLSVTGRSISTRSSPPSNRNARPIRPSAPKPASRTIASGTVDPAAELRAVVPRASSNARCATSPSAGAWSTNAPTGASAPAAAPRSMSAIAASSSARFDS